MTLEVDGVVKEHAANDAADTIVAQGGCLSSAMLSAQKGLLVTSFEQL